MSLEVITIEYSSSIAESPQDWIFLQIELLISGISSLNKLHVITSDSLNKFKNNLEQHWYEIQYGQTKRPFAY